MATLTGPNFAAHDVDDAELQRFIELASRRAEKSPPGIPYTPGEALTEAIRLYNKTATKGERKHLDERGAGLVQV